MPLISRSFLAAAFILCLGGSPLAATAAASPAVSAEAPSVSVRIGITEPAPDWDDEHAVEKTLAYLREKLPRYRIEAVKLPNTGLEKEALRVRPDFLISTSSTYLQVAWSQGAHRLVHKRSSAVPDIQHAVGSVFIVPADSSRPDIASLKGAVAAARTASGFADWLIAKGELASRGFDPDRFFSRELFEEKSGLTVPQMLRSGAADAGVLPACALEKLIEKGLVRKDEFRVLEPKGEEREPCARSTEGYPDLVFASMAWSDAGVVKDFMVALLELPVSDYGFEWSTAHDLNPVLALMKTLRLPPYEYLNDRTVLGFVRLHWEKISLVLLVILGLVLHNVRANRLVARRTAELTEAMKEKEAIFTELAAWKDKTASLERAGIVSYMSNLFAHEIRQPITNILFYAATLENLCKAGRITSETLPPIIGRIREQANRSNEIVVHVRDYAKAKESAREPVRLAKACENALAAIRLAGGASCRAECLVPADAAVLADAFEIEFVVSTFLKNAFESLKGEPNPRVLIKAVRRQNRLIELSVEDNGPAIPDEEFDRLGHYGSSAKPQGLGFGLAIASEIAERSGGHLEFRRNTPGGLIACLVLPEIPS